MFVGLSVAPVADIHAAPDAGHHGNSSHSSAGHSSAGQSSDGHAAAGDRIPDGEHSPASKAVSPHCGAIACATSSAGVPAASGYHVSLPVSACGFVTEETTLKPLCLDSDPPVPKTEISRI
tara:strand:+ start:116 stop:478 length:363 start_codon:yes stop_codon:yes gene_type:complete